MPDILFNWIASDLLYKVFALSTRGRQQKNTVHGLTKAL